MASSYIGKVLDNYRIIENLGIGGMGVVFKAIHIKLDKLVALKMIAPGLAMNENFIKRFEKEAKALAKLHNPNIVAIHDLRSYNDQWFIVMEYVDGINLYDQIRKNGAYKWQEAIPIIKQILSAIGHAHDAGIIHRDLKPNNVMITKQGKIKITDFGLAKDQSSLMQSKTVSSGGTLFYMSPEHVKGFSYTDTRSDIYSIGITFYEMLSGKLPFENINSDFDLRETIVRKEIQKPTELNPDIPPELESIIMKAISKNPDKRFQTTVEMLEAINKYSTKQGYAVKKDRTIKLSKDKIVRTEEDKKNISQDVVKNDQKKVGKLKRWIIAAVLFLIVLVIYNFYPDFVSKKKDVFVSNKYSSLSISSNPENASVFLNTDSIGITPVTKYQVNAGIYSLRISNKNYISIDTSIHISDTLNLNLSFSLKPKIQNEYVENIPQKESLSEVKKSVFNASISVDSNPAQATIWINGKNRGKTPNKITNLQRGMYNITIKKSGFEDYSTRIRLSDEKTYFITSNLVSTTGILSVETEPEGAILFLNNKQIENQTTPIQMNQIQVGKYQFRLHKHGFEEYTGSFEIKPNKSQNIKTKLKQLLGNLSIHALPWGSIYVDDQLQKASTDIKFEMTLTANKHKIKVVHPTLGFWEKIVDITANDINKIVVNFNRQYAIFINCVDKSGSPLEAKIYADEKDTGFVTPQEIILRTGVHKIRVKKDGYTAENEEKEVLIESKNNKPQIFVLEKVN